MFACESEKTQEEEDEKVNIDYQEAAACPELKAGGVGVGSHCTMAGR